MTGEEGQENGLQQGTVPCGISYIIEAALGVLLPNYARRGSHVQIQLAPTPPRLRPWFIIRPC